jgi:hypothetical protein
MRFISYAVIFHADANASDSECETLSYKKSQIGFVKAPTIIAIGVWVRASGESALSTLVRLILLNNMIFYAALNIMGFLFR